MDNREWQRRQYAYYCALGALADTSTTLVSSLSLNSPFTVARASGEYGFAGDGRTLVNYGNNLPAFDSAGRTRVYQQSTNLLLQSEAFDNASWAASAGAATPNTVTAPNGTLTADVFVPNTSNTLHALFQQAAAVTAGATVIVKIALKPAGYSYMNLRVGDIGQVNVVDMLVNASTGAIISTTPAGTAVLVRTLAPLQLANGWWLFGLVMNIPAQTAYTIFNYVQSTGAFTTYAGDGTSGVAMWGADIKADAFGSPYIPTTTTTATRLLDSITAPFSSLFPISAGTLYGRFIISAVNLGTQCLLGVDDGSANNGFVLRNPSGTATVTPGRTLASAFSGGGSCGTIAQGVSFAAGLTFDATGRAAAYVAGGVLQAVTGGPTSGLTKVTLGSTAGGASGQLNGAIGPFYSLPYAASDLRLQALVNGVP